MAGPFTEDAKTSHGQDGKTLFIRVGTALKRAFAHPTHQERPTILPWPLSRSIIFGSGPMPPRGWRGRFGPCQNAKPTKQNAVSRCTSDGITIHASGLKRPEATVILLRRKRNNAVRLAESLSDAFQF